MDAQQDVPVIIPEYCLDEILVSASDDYWGQPEIISTFGYSKKSSRLASLNGAYLRVEKTQATSIWPDISLATLESLKSLGVHKVKFLPSSRWISGEAVQFWYSTPQSISSLKAKTRWRIRKALDTFQFSPVGRSIQDRDSMFGILNNWLVETKKRKFLVTKGHYEAVIRAHQTFKRSVAFFISDGARYVGLVGGYLYDNYAVCVLAKHDYSHPLLGRAMWAYWMNFVHDECRIPIMNCGDTADQLKRSLGMTSRKAYRPRRVELDG